MRYAIITDIHEDLVSLSLVMKKIEKLHCDELICLGDISGFCIPNYHYIDTRNARECLRHVRENCSIVILGNHDLHAAKKLPESSPEFDYPENWYQLDYHERKEASKGKLWLYDNNELDPLYKNSDIEYLETLQEYAVLKTPSANVLLSHYLFPNLTGSGTVFYSENNEFAKHKNFMAEKDCSIGFSGHRHFAGLLASTNNGIVTRRYKSRHFVMEMDCIHVPPLAGNTIGNGFCIFDTDDFTVKMFRV